MNRVTILTESAVSAKSEDLMKTPEFVDKILSFAAMGWKKKTIAKELGITTKTVKKYLKQGGWVPYTRKVCRSLVELDDWLEQSFHLHNGNAAVVKQELLRQHGLSVNIRTVQRAVHPFRRKLIAQEKATIRFETPPGKQLQIDFGSMNIVINGKNQRVYFFVSTLGYSRRMYAQAFSHERQTAWFQGIEGAFYHFGGVPKEVLLDNPKSLVSHHNSLTREVKFNERFHTFASYWKFKPRACAPYRARTKGKDESGVKYLKRNCIAGRTFQSWEELEKHLTWWLREVSDTRIHGTTGEQPINRFMQKETSELNSLDGKPPFNQIQEYQRVVHSDSCVEIGTNRYSVPWEYIAEEVTAQIISAELIILYGASEIARHPISLGKRDRIVRREHLSEIVGSSAYFRQPEDKTASEDKKVFLPELLRPLAEYEALVGGGW